MSTTYSRGERALFHLVDASINALSTLFLTIAYLAGSFALFAAATALYGWYGYHDAVLAHQFLHFGAMMLYYVGAPLMALTCITIYCQAGWRRVWQAQTVFEEKRLHPAFVFLFGLACCMVTYTANVSLGGQWRTLPNVVARVLEVRTDKVKASVGRPKTPRQIEAKSEAEAAGKNLEARPIQN